MNTYRADGHPVFALQPFVEAAGVEAVERPHTGVRAIIGQMIDIGAAGPCAKSKRVAAVVDELCQLTPVIAVNGPPGRFTCGRDDECRKACGRICVHAEERALLQASARRPMGFDPLWRLHVLHLHVIDGEPVPSRSASCETCSRKMLEFGIHSMWLFLESGWRRWSAEDFHLDTLKNLGLPHKLGKERRP